LKNKKSQGTGGSSGLKGGERRQGEARSEGEEEGGGLDGRRLRLGRIEGWGEVAILGLEGEGGGGLLGRLTNTQSPCVEFLAHLNS
jgi:hypothetical protein